MNQGMFGNVYGAPIGPNDMVGISQAEMQAVQLRLYSDMRPYEPTAADLRKLVNWSPKPLDAPIEAINARFADFKRRLDIALSIRAKS